MALKNREGKDYEFLLFNDLLIVLKVERVASPCVSFSLFGLIKKNPYPRGARKILCRK